MPNDLRDQIAAEIKRVQAEIEEQKTLIKNNITKSWSSRRLLERGAPRRAFVGIPGHLLREVQPPLIEVMSLSCNHNFSQCTNLPKRKNWLVCDNS